MGREAFEMSVSPTVNLLKPPPVPETPTFTRTLVLIFPNSSATASETGKTVLEPSISIVPLSVISGSGSLAGSVVVELVVTGRAVGVGSSSSPPQAATASARSRPTTSGAAYQIRSFVLNEFITLRPSLL